MHVSPTDPRVVGLTGGIASGKSTISNLFSELGVPVIDSDQIARELVTPGEPALTEIAERFGRHCLLPDGRLDRVALRQIVFDEPKLRNELNAILHPRIRAETNKRIAEVTHPYCLVVVPLLVESGLTSTVDSVLVVDLAESDQLARLIRRDGISAELASKMIAAQATRRERLDVADHVIDNTGSIETLRGRVAALDRQFRKPGPAG